MTEYEAPSWEYFYELCVELGEKVRASGFNPDVLLGVSRGGLIPVRILSDLYEGVEIGVVRVEFYRGIEETEEEPRITQPPSVELRDKRVLVVDDVADTGKTLKTLKEYILSAGAREAKIAVVYYKPWSVLKPDYYVKETEKWIIFPHEIRESIFKILRKGLSDGRKVKDVRKELIDAGLRPSIVDKYIREFLNK